MNFNDDNITTTPEEYPDILWVRSDFHFERMKSLRSELTRKMWIVFVIGVAINDLLIMGWIK